MEPIGTKVLMLVLLLVITVISGIVPVLVITQLLHRGHTLAISCLNCFVAGVFMATTLLHLLPETRTHLANTMEGFPLSEFLMCIGFFIVLSVEILASLYNSSREYRGNEYMKLRVTCNKEEGIQRKLTDSDNDGEDVTCAYGNAGVNVEENDSDTLHIMQYNNAQTLDNCVAQERNLGHKLQDEKAAAIVQGKSRLSAIVLLIAMSCHSIFEGIALGLQKESPQLWSFFAALSLHKAFITFTIGSTLAKSFKHFKLTLILICMFAVIAPLGIIIGVTILNSGTSDSGQLVQGVLEAIATGTFLYVTLFEILAKEISPEGGVTETKDLLKLFASFTGLCLAAAMQLLPDGDHG